MKRTLFSFTLLLSLLPAACLARPSVSRDGTVVRLQNEQVSVEYDLAIDTTWHQLAFYNPDAKAEIKVINNEADGLAILRIDSVENAIVDWSLSLK